jgi:hypothetical protein
MPLQKGCPCEDPWEVPLRELDLAREDFFFPDLVVDFRDDLVDLRAAMIRPDAFDDL